MSLSLLPNDILNEISRKIIKITDKRVLSMTNKHFLAILKTLIQSDIQSNIQSGIQSGIQSDILNYSKIDTELYFEYNIDYEKARDGYCHLIYTCSSAPILAYYGLIELLKKRKGIYLDLMKYAIYGNQPDIVLFLCSKFNKGNMGSLATLAASRGYLDCLKILYNTNRVRINSILCCAAIPNYDCFKYLLEKAKYTPDISHIVRCVIEQDNLDRFKLLENDTKQILSDCGLSFAIRHKSTEIIDYLLNKAI